MTRRKCVAEHPHAVTTLAKAASILLVFAAWPSRAWATIPGLFDPSEEAHPGALLEVMYSRAEISFGQGKLKESVEMLNHLLATSEGNVPALHLKLSALRKLGDLQGVADTYQALMWAPSEKARVPQYAFECGLVYRQLDKPKVARVLFEQALAGHYMESASHFFLGQLDLDNGDAPSAQTHFLAALRSEQVDPQVAAASLYQLGTANLADGHAYFGNALVRDAWALSNGATDPGILVIGRAAAKTLQPLDRSQWFGSVATMGSYDSNVAQLPTANNPSGAAVGKLTLDAGIGHANSMLDPYQFVESLRFYGNLNFFNPNAALYEYETLAPTLIMTHAPLSRVPWGIKLDGGFTAQGQSGGFLFPFFISGDASAFVRWRRVPRSEIELSMGVQPESYTSTESEASGFSGLAEYAHASWRWEGTAYWNPTWGATLTRNATTDPTNSYILGTANLADAIHLSRKDTLNALAQLDYYAYTGTARDDIAFTLSGTGTHDLSRRLALVANVSLALDDSSESALYSYVRFIAGFGISLSL